MHSGLVCSPPEFSSPLFCCQFLDMQQVPNLNPQSLVTAPSALAVGFSSLICPFSPLISFSSKLILSIVCSITKLFAELYSLSLANSSKLRNLAFHQAFNDE
ncbi:hypothetical protein VNO77_25830 [Canavalia gladiata]|uniref:Uncharacterized protein n=1 Tax=Canavalia gladiata TaxID=3824 RepID=A0AAN9KR99_CANGL